MQNFRELKVWQKSHQLTLGVYRATRSFPKEEQFALTSQMRRASSSIPANIAEGCCRNGDAEFARFLYIAMGSASELECHLLLARDLGFLSEATARGLEDGVGEVKRMLSSLIRRLKADS
jgi:four helix bundle protein